MDRTGRGARPGWVSDELFPFESRWLDVDGHRVHHVDEGTGPTLLLLHGNPTWSFLYRDVVQRLRTDFRCLAVDLPGFGLSEAAPGYRYTPAEHAEVVLAVIERLDLGQATLVVHDWGGPVGLWAAARARERFCGLVVANTWAWPLNGDLHFEISSRTLGGLVGRELIRRLNLFVNLVVPLGHRRRSPSAPEMAHYRAALSTRERRHASAVLPQAIRTSRAFLADVEQGLSRLRHLPALVLWGEADVAFRGRERERWEAMLPSSTTVRLPGVGHHLQAEAPQEFAEALRDWQRTAVAPSG